MERLRSLALPAAICVAFAGACQDAPLEPRAPAQRQATAAPRHLGTESFSGQAADSVMELLEHAWSRFDRSPSLHSRLDWRLRNNVPARVHDNTLMPSRGTPPNALLTNGGSAVVPQILSHTEGFHFGYHDQSNTVPSAVNADMTFIGDQGEIVLASLTITPDAGGTPYATGGRITMGSGELINCADVTFGTCTTRHLGSAVVLPSTAPDCNARASGTVTYWSAVSTTVFGVSWGTTPPSSTGSGISSVSASAPISGTAGQCSSGGATSGSQPSDSTTTPGTGTVGPPPPPTGPNVPTAPPPPTVPESGTGGGYYCQQTDLYSVYGGTRTLISTVIDCYPNT